jgi:hypothetical protein
MNNKSEIRDKFNNVTISDILKSIRSVFQQNANNSYVLNYSPPYQRNYVWSEIKATYFIETILVHGEIPPFVIYEKGGTWEVIDGKQRAETIIRYLNGQFALKGEGLEELWNLVGKTFSELEENLQERILNTVLRFIIIKTRNENEMDAYSEELVKREIFKRHNQGITPLKKEDVYKAQYLQNEIDLYFKNQFKRDPNSYDQVSAVFNHRKKNLEKMMQHIRQLLVLQNIPINRFASKKEEIVNQYYDFLSYSTTRNAKKESISKIFRAFMDKVNFLIALKADLDKRPIATSWIIYDLIFWALSVCEKEKVSLDKIDNPTFKTRLINHIEKNADKHYLDRSHHIDRIKIRYGVMADFFHSQLKISFFDYLHSSKEFLVSHKALMSDYLNERFKPGLEQEYFSKPFPTAYTVADILDMIKRGKFNLRPPYQRKEVMSKIKASSLIESMLLGIKLHPIYVFIRQDGITEVIDGQQRLLAIIAFLGQEFRNEDGELEFSKKNKFALQLQQGLLPQYNKMKFLQLPEDLRKYLYNYTIHFIEIKEGNNKSFVPETLFKRLNHKPCPIKDNSFEYWNSYVDTDIMNQIKAICKRNSWLYLRKNDVRMLNEELVTCLSYLHYMCPDPVPAMAKIKEVLSIHQGRSGIKIWIKNKKYITYVLENSCFKEDFLKSLINFETDFLEKIKVLISTQSGEMPESVANRRMDSILQTNGNRFGMGYIILWLILLGIPNKYVRSSRIAVLDKIRKLFLLSKRRIPARNFEAAITDNWNSVNQLIEI